MKQKLIRDNIPKIIKDAGKEPKTHIATDEEYWTKLKEKLLEEVKEFLESEDKSELADINEVLKAIYDFKKIDLKKIEKFRKEKVQKRGGFLKKIILDEVV